jgi:IS30 family transposase
MGYTHEKLKENERRRIERLRASGWGVRRIARALGRSPSTISEELARVRGTYTAKKAEHKAYVKRKYSKVQSMKVVTKPLLREYVEEKLKLDWSPEMIAGRIRKIDRHLPPVSIKAIYKFVYSVYGRKLEKHLYRKRVKAKGGPKRGTKVLNDGRTSIEKRPKHVENRKQFGHFEGDFIESGKDGEGSLLVLVERKTRYPFIAYCPDRGTAAVNELIARLLRQVRVRSITLDNDISFQKHKELSELLQTIVYFCHSYASNEKGTVENRNGKVRHYGIPKRTDLSQVSEETIRMIETKLRSLPLKCLGFQTPQEAWDAEMKKAACKAVRVVSSNVLKANVGCSD